MHTMENHPITFSLGYMSITTARCIATFLSIKPNCCSPRNTEIALGSLSFVSSLTKLTVARECNVSTFDIDSLATPIAIELLSIPISIPARGDVRLESIPKVFGCVHRNGCYVKMT